MDDPEKGPRLLTIIVQEVVIYERFQLQGFDPKNSYNGFTYGKWSFTRGGHSWKFNSVTLPCKIQVQHSEFHKQAMC